MKRIRAHLCLLTLALFSAFACPLGLGASEAERLFALKLQPLFASKCFACHGEEPDKLKGGLDMRDRKAMLRGGETFGERVLIPGSGADSFLYRVTTRAEEAFEMPPKEADQLSAEEQGWIRTWIDAGAPWPNEETIAQIQDRYAQGVRVQTSKALSEDWRSRRYDPAVLWAYQPLDVESVPNTAHPVDWFIDRRLKEAGLEPAPDADPQALVRRMSFGLTGLPPLPEAVVAFITNYAENPGQAVKSYATELMTSPHYGEQFGRHWLDVVRYADSAGFANDYARPNAWRYRDYVIRAFNQDKPYNDFVREQLAGDERDSTNPENLVATGFLRMGPWEHTSMSVFKETRQMWLDDITDSVGQTFLGHALQCAKCHDHKFDPVPTRDYYRMMAVFSTTQFAEREASFLPEESQAGFENADTWAKAKIAAYKKQETALNEAMAARRRQETGSAKVGDNGLDPGDEASLARMRKNIVRHGLELDRTKPLAMAVYTGKTILRHNINGRSEMPPKPWAKGYFERDAILTGGNVYAPGDNVRPGALSAAESLGGMKASTFPRGQGKRRSALAEWIVDHKNPLTARVMVNRVWSWHFGQGLAGNPNNVGATGEPPSHPKLLDFLAHWFMENGWSVQRLNALIVSSQAYRRSSQHPNQALLAERDPKQRLYATFGPRRLAAEEIRDAMLAASGELNRQVGGIPARPDINDEVATQPRQIMGGTASVYEPDPLPAQRNRRSVYAERLRGLRDPFLEAFNQPGPDDSCELREVSTVAPQALTLFNAQEVHDRALALAVRLLELGEDSAEEIIRRAFALTLSREPSAEELSVCVHHWQEAEAYEEDAIYPKKTFPTEITRTVMAEKTGEPYDFVEVRPAYARYRPDWQPGDVDARTRGLAQVCLVLFNSNEFAYLD